ncbi:MULTISPECIES: hypothetical protein [Streptomyces]|uniref:Insecticidal crystal toxin domain-containing protein n=1 Tax=Streptomyces galilaeus TaxID=33899 RepID=A0ABW9IMK0_STRGJ
MITQKYGELEVGFTSRFTKVSSVSNDQRAHLYNVWRPEAPEGWFIFGHIAVKDTEDPNGRRGAVIARDLTGGSILKPVQDVETICEYSLPGTPYAFGFYRPVAPAGFAALGDLALNKPNLDGLSKVAVVNKAYNGWSYARPAETGESVYTGTMAFFGRIGLWTIAAPLLPGDDVEERLLLPTGTFTAVTHTDKPAPTPSTYMLDLPAVVEKDGNPRTPELTSYDPPLPQQVITDRVLTLPYFMVNDTEREEAWKVEHSPFYRLQRKRHFELVAHEDFRGAGDGSISREVQEGVSEDKEETFSETTGVTVSESVGVEVSAGAFGMGASTSVESTVSQSVETGYSRRYNVGTMHSVTMKVTYNVPKDHAGALWTEAHELVPIRGNDTLVTKYNLMFKTNNYVGRCYPPVENNPIDTEPAGTSALDSGEEFDLSLMPAELAERIRQLKQ